MKPLKNYNKPSLKKHGDIKKITKGAWDVGHDGVMQKRDSD